MLNFSSYLIEQTAQKKYIAVQYDGPTQRKLRAWAKENGFDLTVNYNGDAQSEEDFDFHTTIFYSETKHDMSNNVITLVPSGDAKVVDIMMLGVYNNIPVLKIESSAIRSIRKYFEDEFEMKDKWPEYKPHISLSYSKKLPDMSKVKLPTFPLKFNRIEINDAKEF
jgi:hypothetical protein